MRQTLTATLVATSILAATSTAFAHITLEQGQAPAQSAYKAVLRVPHGCDGKATTAIKVKIPAGVIVVKPQPKAGWKLATVRGKYAKSYDYFGTSIDEGVTEIDWTGGELPDEWYDEFVFRGQLAGVSKDDRIYFPTVQECGAAVDRWIELPAAGEDPDKYEHPAPGLLITTPAPSDD